MTPLEFLGRDTINNLRAHGYVIIHSGMTRGMRKAGLSALGWCDGDIERAYNRIVAESIRYQNERHERKYSD